MIGASFGTMLALELASKLEGDNMNGQLILLDGGPDYLKHPDTYSPFRYMEDYATQSIVALVELAYPGISINYKLLFKGLSTVEQKIDTILNYFQKSQVEPNADLTKIFHGIGKREKFYKEYDGSHLRLIESNILLIRPEESKKLSYADETYGLNKYARHDVVVKFVDGNHISMYESPRFVQLIKECLEAVD